MLKAVIFDLDGVLMEFNLDSKAIKGEVIAFLVKNGMKSGLLSPTDPFSSMKEATRSYFIATGRDPTWVENLIADADKIPVGHEVEAARMAKLLPRVRETLAALRDLRIRLAVFTYNNCKATGIALEKHGLVDLFDSVVCRDMVSRPKPNPVHLRAVLDSIKVGVSEALVVGDSEMDIKPSKELGIPVVAVTTGVRSAEFLRGLGPDFLVDNIYQVVEIVKEINGS